jgi:hypothetical protein
MLGILVQNLAIDFRRPGVIACANRLVCLSERLLNGRHE